MSIVEELVIRIREYIEKLATAARRCGRERRHLILQIEHHQLHRERDEKNVPPLWRECEPHGVDRKRCRGRRRVPGNSTGQVPFQLQQLGRVGPNLKLLDDDIGFRLS
ncbi:hypothetical protein PS1_024048 [Malus domestica]